MVEVGLSGKKVKDLETFIASIKKTKRKGKGKIVDDDEEVVDTPKNGEIIVWSFTFQNLLNSHHLFFSLLKLLSNITGERFSNLVMSMWVLT